MHGSISLRFFTAFCDVVGKECKLEEDEAAPHEGQEITAVTKCLGAECLQARSDGSGRHLLYTDIPALYREYAFNITIRDSKCRAIYDLYSAHLQRMLGGEVKLFNENEKIVISVRGQYKWPSAS
jgi:hypothetical protein